MSKPVTVEEFKRRIEIRFPNESFSIISYNGMGKPAIIKCNTCGQELKPSTATNFLIHSKAHGCVNCFGLYKERERKLHEIELKYDILDTFVKNTHTYYHIKCKQCGHERTSDLKNLYKHLNCGCQTGVFRGRTGEEFINQVNKNCEDSGYELVSEYKNQSTKVLIRHKECGFIWNVWPHDLINGRSSCPKCGRIESRGVRYITKLLDESGIFYKKEKRLENSNQRFDFYIEQGKIKIAIEYNGRQHYEQVDYFKGSSLEVQQMRDQKKRDYCKKNQIKLIEIPYTYSLKKIKDIIKDVVYRLNDQSKDVKIK